MKKIFYYLSLAAMVTMTACGSDDEPGPGADSGLNSNSDITTVKNYLTDVAQEFNDVFKPADQEEIVNLAKDLADLYEDYEMPEFDFSADRYAPGKFFRYLAKGLNGNLGAATRAANYYVYNVNLNRIAGVYEPDAASREWVKTSSSPDVIFRCRDSKGQECQVKVTFSATTSDFTVETEDDDYYWNGYEYVYETDNYTYNVKLPHQVKVALTKGNTTLSSAIVNSKVNKDMDNLSVDADLTAANINVTAKMEGTNSVVSESAMMKVGGRTVVNTNAIINGNRLLDQSGDIDPEYVFKNGTATSSILDKLNVRGNFNGGKTFWDAIYASEDWDNWEWDSQQECMADINKHLPAINNGFSGILNYLGADQAKIMMDVEYDGYGSYWSYYLTPVIVFGDGSQYTTEDVGDRYDSILSIFEDIVDTYQRFFKF